MQNSSAMIDYVEDKKSVACQVEDTFEIDGKNVLVVESREPSWLFLSLHLLHPWPWFEAMVSKDSGNRLFADFVFQLASRNHPCNVSWAVARILSLDSEHEINDRFGYSRPSALASRLDRVVMGPARSLL